jgi:hypothetical protein
LADILAESEIIYLYVSREEQAGLAKEAGAKQVVPRPFKQELEKESIRG